MPSRFFRAASVAFVVSALGGCATSLRVHEIAVGASGTDIPARHDGIIVNKRAAYRVTVVRIPGFASASSSTLTGVDQASMLSIDICRYPFASGKLTLSLNDHQQPQSIEVSGEPGVAGAITAATEALTTKTELEADDDDAANGE